jgi:hypothetical protein
MLLQSIRAAPVNVTVAGAEYVVEPADAGTWITAIVGDPLTGVVPKMLRPADRAEVFNRLLTGEITNSDLAQAHNDALAVATGREWWVATRLIGAVDTKTGELYGRLLLSGIGPHLTIAAWCSGLLAMIMDGRDDKGRMKIEFDLYNPPAGVDPQEATGFDSIQF